MSIRKAAKLFVFVLCSLHLSGARADAYADMVLQCQDMLAHREALNLKEISVSNKITQLTQQAIDDRLMSLDTFAIVLAVENYNMANAILALYSAGLNEYRESVIGLVDDKSLAQTLVGKQVLSQLIDQQNKTYRSDLDKMWSRLSSARVINAMISDGLLFNNNFTEQVLRETALEINVDRLYTDKKTLDPKLNAWIRGGQWNLKKDQLKRISFFVLRSLRAQAKGFAKYHFLINIEPQDKPLFDAFLRDFIEASVVDTLTLALKTHQVRPQTFMDNIKDVRDNALLAGAAAGAVAGIYIDRTSALGYAAGAAAICGSTYLILNSYDNFKVWLAQRRLKMKWAQVTHDKCHNYYNVVLEMMRE
jgi:hypothetical protein